MGIFFYTKNINQQIYRSLIHNIIINLDPRPDRFKIFLRSWTIRIIPLAQTDVTFYDHVVTTTGEKINPNMPSGVTGKFTIDLYLHDDDNEFKFLENSNRIQHEICHALLIGTPYFVKGVHDKISAGGAILSGFVIREQPQIFGLSAQSEVTSLISKVGKHMVQPLMT